MRVRVRLFGALADGAGARVVEVEAEPPVDAGAVVAAVRRRHPSLAGLVDRSTLAVDHEVVDATHPVPEDAEVALLPPVAGGARGGPGPRVLVGLRDGHLAVDEALAAVADPAAGATVLFVGTVRDHSEAFAEVERLEYEAYDTMARRVLTAVTGEVADRWPAVLGVAILHAVGELPVGAPTIAVACSAPHRDDAFAACRYGLEEVKARAPIWKREVAGDRSRWIGAASDDPPSADTRSSSPD